MLVPTRTCEVWVGSSHNMYAMICSTHTDHQQEFNPHISISIKYIILLDPCFL